MNEAKKWNDKAIALDEQGKADEALEAWNEAIRQNPSYAEAWYNKGAILNEQGKLDEAFEAWDEAIRLDPNFVDWWDIKGYKLYIQGRYDEAIKAYCKTISIKVYLRMAWWGKAGAFDTEGKNDEANEAYDKVEKIQRQIAKAFYNKGIALAVQGKNDEARKSYRMAMRNFSDEELLQDQLTDEEWRKITGPDLKNVSKTRQDTGIERQLKKEIEQELLWQDEQKRQELLWQDEQKRQRELELEKQGSSESAENEWRDIQIREQVLETQNVELEQQKEQRRLELEEEDRWKQYQDDWELGDYDLLRYRCEEDLENGLDDFIEDEYEGDEHSRLLRSAKLEMVEPQSAQSTEYTQENLPYPQENLPYALRFLLLSNGGKMRVEDARLEMHLAKELFSLILDSMSDIEIRPNRLDETEPVIILKSDLARISCGGDPSIL